jgi:ferredoxin
MNTTFRFYNKQQSIDTSSDKTGISRKEFLVLLSNTVFMSGCSLKNKYSINPTDLWLIRPPGSVKEQQFLNRCIRCGNCMKVCITNGLQPTFVESGLTGIWTPKLVPEIGQCDYNCTLCGSVCPTGAIPRLPTEKKQSVKLGTAEIDTLLCLPYNEHKECIVCHEHCPIPEKAILLVTKTIKNKTVSLPVVDKKLCIGCGICQNKCPVRPVHAIKVNPNSAERT